MHKYKYFLVLLSGIVLVSFMLFFPISFDNNDDQAMYFINSGILSGTPSPYIIHTNLIIGLFVSKLFFLSNQINWYTLYLQLVQLVALLTIYLIIIRSNKINFLISFFLLCFLVLGFSALCIMKLQFTIVALLCCATSLFCIYSEFSSKTKYTFALLFIIVAILIRKDSFFIFIVFNSSILLIKFYKREVDKMYLVLLSATIIVFFGLKYIHENGADYKKYDTLKYCSISDAVADKPTQYNDAILEQFHFTKDDMVMMKARFPASDTYFSGNNIIHFSDRIKSKRTLTEIVHELKKFVLDERYIILIYLLSIIIILGFAPKQRWFMLLNGFVFVILLLYLATFIRIPHRVTFPILVYVSVLNLFLFFKENRRHDVSLTVAIIFAILGSYKFYCTCKLIGLHTEYHAKFEACQQEIKMHPDYLFISLHDGLPIEYMNAWQPPNEFFIRKNLITTGWNVTAPDFQQVLQQHQLNNLTTDLKQRQQVLFLTNNEAYLKSYVNVMKQRYNLDCHFENFEDGFKTLHPKKLVFDN